MEHVFDFYSEQMELEQLVGAMKHMKRSSRCVHESSYCLQPKTFAPLGKATDGCCCRCNKMIQQAFLDLRPVRRLELLESMKCCGGLFKVSNDPLATVYELRLEG